MDTGRRLVDRSRATHDRVPLSRDPIGAKVPLGDLDVGCYGQDCIPSIDQPEFEQVVDADSWLHDVDIVFSVTHEDATRAYPQRILNWHEIVNDTLQGVPIIVTFCPLCGSALAFVRKVKGQEVEFGVSGLLYNSDLIMYDRNEGSLWQQLTGQAIVGPAAQRNEVLQPVPMGMTTWGLWKSAYPGGQVLSRRTGYHRNYERYPYGSYEHDDRLSFPVHHRDPRLPLKIVVYGIEVDGVAKAYPDTSIRQGDCVEDILGSTSIIVERDRAGAVHVKNGETGELIPSTRTFWFSWAAFHPSTAIFSEVAAGS